MRLDGLDIARFAAFAGMVLVNFRIAAGIAPDGGAASALIDLLEGRAAALFVVLAGIGFALGRADRATTLRRAAFLFGLGLINLTIFEADILHYYALFFLVALPFATQPAGRLMGLAWITLGLGLVALLVFDYERGWTWETLHYADFWTLEGFLRHSFYNGWHPVLPWVSFFFVGMWAGRLGLASRTRQALLAIGGAAVALATGGLSRWLSALDPELAEIAGTAPIPPGPLYFIAASGSALSAIGLLLLAAPALARLGLARWFTLPGRMALTLYLAHILLGMGALEALGLLDGSLSNTAIAVYALTFCAFAALFARAWFARFPRGPLEGLMRRLTKG